MPTMRPTILSHVPLSQRALSLSTLSPISKYKGLPKFCILHSQFCIAVAHLSQNCVNLFPGYAHDSYPKLVPSSSWDSQTSETTALPGTNHTKITKFLKNFSKKSKCCNNWSYTIWPMFPPWDKIGSGTRTHGKFSSRGSPCARGPTVPMREPARK